MKLIIYGINECTIEIVKAVSSSNEIIALSDSYSDKKTIYGYEFVKPIELRRMDFDYVIVCVKTRNTYETIKAKLASLGVSVSKILSFYNLYYESRVDQVMLKAKNQKRAFDGIVLGISHAAYAINPIYLDGNWANVAAPSEDLINHNFVLDKLISYYYEQIRGVKTIIIDLYDYTVLNFITSFSKYYIDFYDLFCGDGIEFQDTFAELEKAIHQRNNYSSSYARQYRELRQELFDDEAVFESFRQNTLKSPTPIDFFYKECVLCESAIDPMNYGKNFIPKIQHDSNISANIEQLKILIEKIYRFSPDVRVCFVFIPRIAEIEQELCTELVGYRNILYKEIDILAKRFPDISIHDYKGVNEISLYREGYCSVGHMNTKGQKRFSEILNKDLIQVR